MTTRRLSTRHNAFRDLITRLEYAGVSMTLRLRPSWLVFDLRTITDPRLIQGDGQASEHFRALCKKHDLPADYELHLSYHCASRDMEAFDRAVAHHTNMRMRAFDALQKGRESLAARAEVLIEGEAA